MTIIDIIPKDMKRSSKQRFKPEKLLLCRYIGQAHLLPGMSKIKVEAILAEYIGFADWNKQPIVILEKIVLRIKQEAG